MLGMFLVGVYEIVLLSIILYRLSIQQNVNGGGGAGNFMAIFHVNGYPSQWRI